MVPVNPVRVSMDRHQRIAAPGPLVASLMAWLSTTGIRKQVLISYDLRDDEVQRRAEADRRPIDPGGCGTWSKAGQLDSWVKERQEWSGTRCGRQAALDQS